MQSPDSRVTLIARDIGGVIADERPQSSPVSDDGLSQGEAMRRLRETGYNEIPEAPISPAYKRAILAAGPGATVVSGLFDLLWDFEWPGVRVRAIRNALTDRWAGREDELAAHLEEVRAACERADRADDPQGMALLAGEGVGQIDALQPAGAIVQAIAAEAERVLRAWGARVSA